MRKHQSGTSSIGRRAQLVWAMARREITDRYAGQALGAFWAIGHPLLIMSVYLFVFGFVFRVKVGGTVDLPLDYTIYLLSGLVPWVAIAEALNKSPLAITNNASLVKQVVFPLEVLPLKTVLAALLPQAVSTVILVAYTLTQFGSLPATYALLPVLIIMEVGLLMGLGLILSAMGAYVRDLKDLVQVGTLVGAYLLPVFYLPSMVPAPFRPVLQLNPFTYLIYCFQDVFFFGRLEHPVSWIVTPVLSALACVVGWRLFHRLKHGFGNVL